MTFEDRVEAVAAFGFTNRQARFLVTVMTHSGVCVGRQYCDFAGISYGEPVRTLFRTLEAGRYATVNPSGHGRGRIFHVHYKPLYRAIGQAENRFRRPAPLPRAVERLMVLDMVTADRSVTWLGTEREKVREFTTRVGVPLAALPYLTFRSSNLESDTVPEETTRYFPDKLPIGVSKEGPLHVFLYIAADPDAGRFRLFLERHAALLRGVADWTIRVAFPRHRTPAVRRYRVAFEEQLLTPIPGHVRDELAWYFRQRQASAPALDERHFRAESSYDTSRYRAAYRRWVVDGDSVLDGLVSPHLAEAVRAGHGRLECVVLPHAYGHLVSLVGTA